MAPVRSVVLLRLLVTGSPTFWWLRPLALVTALAGLAGCNSLGCSLIGCQNGLTVRLSQTPAVSFRVELRVTSPTAQPAYVYDCANPALCAEGVFFPDFSGEHAFVTVVTAAGTRTTEITRIEYRISRPNGPDCPPECRQATVTADVPV
jgi:hypothetical protein